MIIGIPKEIKDQEKRVALLPEAVALLVKNGHRVRVQKGAGLGSGYSDAEYRSAGADLVPSTARLYRDSEMIVKVKEPLRAEYRYLRSDLKIFCYLHLAANRALARALLRSGTLALAFETLEDSRGGTPLLKPMSEIAGRLAVTLGSHYLQKNHKGRGVLLSPTNFSPPGRVTVVGGGSVGRAAAELACGLGAKVAVFDIRVEELAGWAKGFRNLRLLQPHTLDIANHLQFSDLVVGAVYVHGARTPKLISRKMVKKMPKGSVLMDVAVDQGGTSETTRPTSISRPIYLQYGVVHCAVTNMPALVSRTASQALSTAILPYVQRAAGKESLEEFLRDPLLASAVNVGEGRILHPKVKASLKG